MTTTTAPGPPSCRRGSCAGTCPPCSSALALVAAVALAIVLGAGTETSTPMDPDNPGPDGARAAGPGARRRGCRRRGGARARTSSRRSTSTTGPPWWSCCPSSSAPAPSTGCTTTPPDAHSWSSSAPGPAWPTSSAPSAAGPRSPWATAGTPGCDDPRFDGLTLEVDSTHRLSRRRLLRRQGRRDRQPRPADRLLLFGADQALTNDQILRADNAAVALRLLGQDERLVWYVPSLDDLTGDDGVSLATLLPGWRRARGCGCSRGRWSPSSCGAPVGSGRWPLSRCRSSSAPWRPPAASAGSTAAPATAATPRRRCGAPPGPGCAERLRLGSTDPAGRARPRGGPPHRPRRAGRRARCSAPRPSYRPPTAT